MKTEHRIYIALALLPLLGGALFLSQKKQKEEADSKLPFVTRTIINVLTFAFKAVVFVMRIAIKVVAGVIVMITRNFSKL